MQNQLKAAVQILSALGDIVWDPSATDSVLEVGKELARDPDLLGRSPVVSDLKLDLRPQRIDLDALGALPEGSLGRCYADYMRANGFTVESLNQGGEGYEMAWAFEHMATSHDVWHVLTNFSPEPAGEIGLQAFGCAQFDRNFAPVIMAAVLLNSVLFAPGDLANRVRAIRAGRAMGAKAKLLLGVDWAPYWAAPLEQVRVEFGLEAVPGERDYALAA